MIYLKSYKLILLVLLMSGKLSSQDDSLLYINTLVNTIKSTGLQIFKRQGSKGFATVLKDFGELGVKNVRTIQTAQGKVITGRLSDGRTVVARSFSKPKGLDPGGPTLEIQGGANPIKIRY